MMVANNLVMNKVENVQGSSLKFLVIHPRKSVHYSMRYQRRSIKTLYKVNAISKMLSSVLVRTVVVIEDSKLKL